MEEEVQTRYIQKLQKKTLPEGWKAHPGWDVLLLSPREVRRESGGYLAFTGEKTVGSGPGASTQRFVFLSRGRGSSPELVAHEIGHTAHPYHMREEETLETLIGDELEAWAWVSKKTGKEDLRISWIGGTLTTVLREFPKASSRRIASITTKKLRELGYRIPKGYYSDLVQAISAGKKKRRVR